MAEAVMLQEVCRTQADHLQLLLHDAWGSASLHYVSTYVGDFRGLNKCEQGDYGMAILAGEMGDRWVEPLPNPGLGSRQIDKRAMPCAQTGVGVVCVTHLVRSANDAAAHEAQVAAFADRTEAVAGQHEAVIVAGDLNDERERFSRLYEGREAPFRAARTSGVDHVFASRASFQAVQVSSRGCDCSDHDALVVTVERR